LVNRERRSKGKCTKISKCGRKRRQEKRGSGNRVCQWGGKETPGIAKGRKQRKSEKGEGGGAREKK